MSFVLPKEVRREFVVEEEKTVRAGSGRSTQWVAQGNLTGALTSATTRELMLSQQADFVISHVVVQPGPPKAKLRQRLRLPGDGTANRPDRLFHIVAVDNPADMGVATVYGCEERVA